jgi:hypothetical protein
MSKLSSTKKKLSCTLTWNVRELIAKMNSESFKFIMIYFLITAQTRHTKKEYIEKIKEEERDNVIICNSYHSHFDELSWESFLTKLIDC